MRRIRKRSNRPLTSLRKINAAERRCIATGATAPTDALVRFALAPDGTVAPDFSMRLPGRGAWVAAEASALEKAIQRNAFSRAFGQSVTVSDNLLGLVEAGLARAALSALGLARRTGEVEAGFEKVKAMLKAGEAAVLICARDGAEDGKRKLRRLAGAIMVVELFDANELSTALGRDHVGHAAIKKGAAALRFLRAAKRLAGFRPAEGM